MFMFQSIVLVMKKNYVGNIIFIKKNMFEVI